MKRIATLMAAIAMMAAGTVANAADQAWFTLSGALPVGASVVDEGPGGPLIVNVDVNLNPNPTLRIGYNFTNTSTAGMNGWAISLAAAGTAAGTFNNGPVAAGNGYDTRLVGRTPRQLSSRVRLRPPATGAAGLVYSFDLAVTGGAGTSVLVLGDFGPSEQFYNSNYAWYGFVGGNPIFYGRVGYVGNPGTPDQTPGWGTDPVIIVNLVPEPATLGLIGLGVVALLRRRR